MNDSELYEKFKPIHDKLTAYLTVNDICKNNDMESLRYLTKSEEYKQLVHPHLGTAYVNACMLNRIEMVKYLLTEPGLTVNVPIRFHNYDALIRACRNGNTDIVKYLLTSPELKEHADVNAQDDSPLYAALKGNHTEIIDYLLNSPNLEKHANIGNALIHAIEKDDLNTIERIYLSFSDLYSDKTDELFMVAYRNKSMATLHYLIFDKNIQKTEEISNCLIENPNIEVERLFQQRELNDNLNNTLHTNINKTKVIKL